MDDNEPTQRESIAAGRLVALVQKPYDLLNAIEYAHCTGREEKDLTAFVIGRHVNAMAAVELCGRRGIAVERLPDPDFYAVCVSYLHASRKFRGKALLVIKALLLPIAYAWWFVAYALGKVRLRDVRCGTLLFDAWRSKSMYMACLSSDHHVLVDGGYSTLHYRLCEAFAAGGGRELVRVALSRQRPLVPSLLRRIFIRKTMPDAIFFTCYEDRIDKACQYPHEANRYRWSASSLQSKGVDQKVLILGIPLLKHIDTYIAAAFDVLRRQGKKALPESIEYRFHPTDRNRSGLDAGYKNYIESGATQRGVHWSYPSYSLEFDFLNGKDVPEVIVCYESSSVAWIRSVMGSGVEVVTLPDR